MSVYVDELKSYPNVKGQAKRYGTSWCHLMADTHDELMAFASRLGHRPNWLQHPGRPTEHFDLVPSRRALAVRLGAREITRHELAAIVKSKMS